jgi:hypothetical protein
MVEKKNKQNHILIIFKMDTIRPCIVCSKGIDFGQNVVNGDEVIMVNYVSFLTKENSVMVLCSKECSEKHVSDFVRCVVCAEVCSSKKWFLHVKFQNLGGWRSIRTCCSEKCRKEIIDNDTGDIEFRYSCWYCKKISEKQLKKCSKCHLAYYCDATCQKNHWLEHKKTCN